MSSKRRRRIRAYPGGDALAAELDGELVEAEHPAPLAAGEDGGAAEALHPGPVALQPSWGFIVGKRITSRIE